ncbi:hypothetical protein H7Y63_01155 [Polaromonas sp.]|nr:hypothetical protein [Candidatus Saccharibacteria bacterium]
MKTNNQLGQQGFGFVVVLLAIVVVGVVTFGAVRVMGENKTSLADTSSVLNKSKVPAKIQTSVELQQASAALDATPVESGVNPDALDKDLDSLL